MAFVQPALLPRIGLSHSSTRLSTRPAAPICVPCAPLEIRAAKHAQFKGAKKADRLRPKKRRPSDKNRKPPSFDPEPLRAEGLPPVYKIIKPDELESAFGAAQVIASAELVAAELTAQDKFEESTTIASNDAQPSEQGRIEEKNAAIVGESEPQQTDIGNQQ
ncbi:unnamed protein product [Agarophyton chilense]